MAAQKFELAVLPGAPPAGVQRFAWLGGTDWVCPIWSPVSPPCTEDSGEARTAVYAVLTMALAVRVE